MVFKARGWVALGLVLLIIMLCSIWDIFAEEDMTLAMAERILPTMECLQDGCTHGRNLGGRGVGRSSVDNDAINLNGVGGEDPREKWFCLENSCEEVHALTRLEQELGSTLLFEHERG